MINKIFLLIILFFSILSCKQQIQIEKDMHNSNLVVEAAIFDFYNKSKLVNRDSTFNVSTSNLNSQILKVVIIGDTNKFYFEDGKPLNRIPNNFVEIKGKLFYWTDSNNEIAENLVLKKLKFYNLVEYDKDIIITHLDHDRKAVTYYFCRNNLNQFKKITSNKSSPLPNSLCR